MKTKNRGCAGKQKWRIVIGAMQPGEAAAIEVSGRCFLMSDNDKNGRKRNSSSGLALGMCIGLSVGTAIGAATQNIGTWMPVGLCLGLALGIAFNKSDDSEESRSDKKE